MTYSGALSVLTGLTIVGVTNYAYNDQPAALPDSALPALVLTLGDTVEYGLRALTINSTASRGLVVVDHTLLYRRMGAVGLRATRISAMAAAIDSYLAAVATNMTLSGNLYEPLVIFEIFPAPVDWAGVVYDACVFRHIWALEL